MCVCVCVTVSVTGYCGDDKIADEDAGEEDPLQQKNESKRRIIGGGRGRGVACPRDAWIGMLTMTRSKQPLFFQILGFEGRGLGFWGSGMHGNGQRGLIQVEC